MIIKGPHIDGMLAQRREDWRRADPCEMEGGGFAGLRKGSGTFCVHRGQQVIGAAVVRLWSARWKGCTQI